MRDHDCPLCRVPGVPEYRATCKRCWLTVPPRIQRHLRATWRYRTVDPVAHREALADLLLWARESGARA